jgi:hypothetical protein
MWHAWESGEVCIGFWWESPREKALGRPGRRWEDGVKMDLREVGWGGVWSVFTWLTIGIIGGLL